MAGFQPEYLSTNRGVTKLIQIILGIVISSILCGNWYKKIHCHYNVNNFQHFRISGTEERAVLAKDEWAMLAD
jgi:hypothetical protein